MAKVKIYDEEPIEEVKEEQKKEEEKPYEKEMESWIDGLRKKIQGKRATVIIYQKKSPSSSYVAIGREEITEAEELQDIIERYGFEKGGLIKAEVRVGGKYMFSTQKEFELKEAPQPTPQPSQPQQEQKSSFDTNLAQFLQTLITQEREKHERDLERFKQDQQLLIERMKAEQQQREQLLTTLFNSISQQTQAFVQMQQALQQQMQQKSDEFMKTMIEILKVQQQPKTDLTEEIAKLKSLGLIPEKQDNTETISKMFELINNSFNLGLLMGLQREPEEKTDVERIINGITDALKSIAELKKTSEFLQTSKPFPMKLPQPTEQKPSEGVNTMKKEYSHPFEKILDDYRGMIIMTIQGPASAKEIADAIFDQIPNIYFDAFCDYVKNKISVEQILKILPELAPQKNKIAEVIENLKTDIELFEKSEKEAENVDEGGSA
jgi:hypothetical protein